MSLWLIFTHFYSSGRLCVRLSTTYRASRHCHVKTINKWWSVNKVAALTWSQTIAGNSGKSWHQPVQ